MSSTRAALLLFLTACGASSGHQPPASLVPCARLQSTPVTTITGVVDRLSGLPQPVSVACLVASLPRPLNVVATNDTVSAQPAGGKNDPRLLLHSDALTLTVTSGGDGAPLLEMGQWVTKTRTLKGELKFPLSAPVDANVPFDRVREVQFHGTSCGLCHRNESPSSVVDGGFESDAFRPLDTTLVDFATVKALHDACTEQSERCDLFHALFDFGLAQPGAFDPSVDTITH